MLISNLLENTQIKIKLNNNRIKSINLKKNEKNLNK